MPALTTRMRNAAPASRRASEDSLPSANSAWTRARLPPRAARHEDARHRQRGACSEPIDATNDLCAAIGGRLARGRSISNEALTFSWKKLTITAMHFHHAQRGMNEERIYMPSRHPSEMNAHRSIVLEQPLDVIEFLLRAQNV